MPGCLYSPSERDFSEVEHVAVAITMLKKPYGPTHVGILHRDESNGSVNFLHLWWRNQLRNEQPRASYGWATPNILKRRARQIAAFCRRVFRLNSSPNPGIPYGFSPPGGALDPNGRFQAGEKHKGLTCASFVLAVFDRMHSPLLDCETWPSSSLEDKEWQRRQLEELGTEDIPVEELEAIKSELGETRYHPEQVAAAATSELIPLNFKEAEALAELVIQQLVEKDLVSRPRES